jgi:hypothetical protein
MPVLFIYVEGGESHFEICPTSFSEFAFAGDILLKKRLANKRLDFYGDS